MTTHWPSRFEEALLCAARLHAEQRRKGSDIPYVAHLMSVSALVLEDGGTEDEAIAGLLHDAMEDQGGRPTLNLIREHFGDNVADIVEGCSDAETMPKPPWLERKQQYLEHLDDASDSVIRVSVADKLHNARAVLNDYQQCGEKLWDRFNASRDQTLWNYRALLSVYRKRSTSPMVDQLEEVLNQLERAIATAA